MTKALLAAHVLVAILAVGPVAVAASMFPPSTRRALASEDPRDLAALRTLHRICRVYAAVGIAVPVLGLATAGVMGVTGQVWVVVSIALTAAAALLLALVVLPGQAALLDDLATAGPSTTARLGMATGAFNLLWAVVTVLMIIRPGSTTGA
ncbi:hypothetical protein [Actinokineospora bangkokensis]|uniref:DUF2269 family protein n=1 Tax=Actinokineospora bangkokensis TaxID=1193682 RepID=A0A1Q9LN98_9PSEU|nr:hypothetical protein [Actinokineospora bangkokensis]OLR93500.1 hypothetical protein BJP25_14435 [Actinokineospora bangkokensis]